MAINAGVPVASGAPGADPNDALLDLGARLDKEDGLKIISLGQGQGPIAERLMSQARMTGDWVCLQNCHLAVSWLPRMEQLLEQQAEEDVNDEYRLWLTSMPSTAFPVPVLQNGLKITNEPPRGIRANLMRTFADLKVRVGDPALHVSYSHTSCRVCSP